MRNLTLAAIACFALSSPAFGEETEAEKSAARLATLFAVVSTEGGTTAKDGAGAIEASMLSASAIWNASNYIKTKLPGNAGAILIFADDQSLSFSMYIGAVRALSNFKSRFPQLRILKGVPSNKCQPPLGYPGGGGAVALAALSGFVGAIRQKTEIASVPVTATSAMLARSVAGNLPDSWTATLPDNMPIADGANSDFGTLFDTLEVENDCWRAYLASLKEDPKKPQIGIAIAAIKTVTDDFSAFSTSISKIDDKGQSQFSQIMAQEALVAQKPKVLRLKVEAAGGTSILRNNFLTLFGADAMRITGGIVVSYSFLDASGLTSGVFVCPTRVATLSSIHSGHLAKATRTKERSEIPNCIGRD